MKGFRLFVADKRRTRVKTFGVLLIGCFLAYGILSIKLLNVFSPSLFMSHLQQSLTSPSVNLAIESYNTKMVDTRSPVKELAQYHNINIFNQTRNSNNYKSYFRKRRYKFSNRPDLFKEATHNKPIKIGLYNVFHGGLKSLARSVKMSKCAFKNCVLFEVAQNDTYPVNASALLFQGNRIPRNIPRRSSADQVFIFLGDETPHNLHFTDLDVPAFRNFFNWTMTYRLDSDIPYTYGQIIPRSVTISKLKNRPEGGCRLNGTFDSYIESVYSNPEGLVGKNYEAIYNQKSENCAWLVSHCQTSSRREEFVARMKTVIDVKIYGECSKMKCEKENDCENYVKSAYKFYLAFENSICLDYITEKAYKWFSRDVIIVVLGARNYMEHLPRGTYIDADDFESPEVLGQYLLELGSNKEEYIRILKRKDSYSVVGHKLKARIAYCHICNMLNNLHLYRKSIDNISEWWEDGVCFRPKEDPSLTLFNAPARTRKHRKR